MAENQCDWCEKRATYSWDVILEGTTIPIKSCDDHVAIARLQQERELSMAQFKDKLRSAGRGFR